MKLSLVDGAHGRAFADLSDKGARVKGHSAITELAEHKSNSDRTLVEYALLVIDIFTDRGEVRSEEVKLLRGLKAISEGIHPAYEVRLVSNE